MRLRRIEIQRFRGIKEFQWDPPGAFVCLIGPGDSTKTTIIDAIELALSPRWNVPFDDADFYDAKTDEPLSITVTVGALPERLKSEATFGLQVRGWSSTGTLHDEPEDGDEVVLSIRLGVASSLEPQWHVINDRLSEGKAISAKDRELLGCARLGAFVDRHFSWGRGSVLSRLTNESDGLRGILADAARAARTAMANAPPESLAELNSAAEAAQRLGAEIGVSPNAEYRTHLDVQSVSVGAGGLSLHDGEIPVRRAGLGTRRLLAVAMQKEVASAGGLTLLDEIEHGLEPHRIRGLLGALLKTEDGESAQHVIMTTHAPVVLQELDAEQLAVVRAADGTTQVLQVPKALQPIVRKASEAFLASKVIVCEGKTELGFSRYLDRYWAGSAPSFAYQGVALADGGGTLAPKVAQALAALGYEVALFGDSDRPLAPSAEELKRMGVEVVLWEGDMCIEERFAADLPWNGIAKVIGTAIAEHGEESVLGAVKSRLNGKGADLSQDPSQWPGDVPETLLRIAVGGAAKGTENRRGWFKRVDLAESMAEALMDNWDAIEKTALGRGVTALRDCVHGS